MKKLILLLGLMVLENICYTEFKSETTDLVDYGNAEWKPAALHLEVQKIVLNCNGIKITIPTSFMSLDVVKKLEFHIVDSSKTVTFVKETK